MKFKKLISLLALFVVVTSSVLASDLNNIKEYKLKNGLTVILHEDKHASDVFGYVVTKAGAKEDPVDQEGIAHYLEHMLFKGNEQIGTINWEKEKVYIDKIYALYEKLKSTKDKKEEAEIQKEINELSKEAAQYACQNELDKVLKDIGSTGLNANTSWDRTVYMNSFPDFQLEKWLKIYSDRFINPVFRGFQAELEVVFEEKNESLDNRNRKMYEELLAKVFDGHEYSRTVLGRVEHIKKPSLVAMKEFYDKYYVPNNMCLILTGNFSSSEAQPLIDKYFGRWEPKDLPKEEVKPVKDFKGGESLALKLGYSRRGSLVYRTVNNKHEDAVTLEFVAQLLSNSTETGLLDQLRLDKKVGGAYSSNMNLNDHGIFTIDYSPKLRKEVMIEKYKQTGRYEPVYESFNGAEKLMLAQVEKLKNGEFEDWKIDAIKKDLIKDFDLSLENNVRMGILLGDVFQKGSDLKELKSYASKIKSITKEDIINCAKKYLGNNYLALNAYEGKPKQKKIEKPGYEPIEPVAGNLSNYAKEIFDTKNTNSKEDYVDFEKDFVCENIRDGVELYYAENPHNDVFSLRISYGAGNHQIKDLEYASGLMNYAGTLKRDISSLKEEFAKISCNYSIYSTDNELIVSVNGDEKYLDNALKLITELLLIPNLDEEKLELLVNSQISSRYYEKQSVGAVANALRQYILYGEKSDYLDRKTIDDLDKLLVSKLVGVYQDATSYGVEMHYCGAKDFNSVKQSIISNLNFKSDLKPRCEKFSREMNKVENDEIYFVHDADAVQCNIFLFVNGEIFNPADLSKIMAFNNYFSGGFSGIVLQEIREKRSLTYGASAQYGFGLKSKPGYLLGGTKTQADKTVEAVKVFKDIVKNMPEKQDRIKNVKSYLTQSLMSGKPSFRSMTPTVSRWKELGFTEDLNHKMVSEINELQFEDIKDFYKKSIAGKPIAICIVGNKSKVDVKGLKQISKLKFISKSKLFSSK